MKRIIKRTLNNSGEKSKTYIYDYKNSVIFHKFTIIPKKDYIYMVGGESIIRQTENYMLTFHRFAVKKSTLFEALSELGLKD